MSVRGLLACLVACVAVLAASASSAWAHAALLTALPKPGTTPRSGPPRVVLRFSEPVEIVRAADVSVVDERGRPVAAGRARTDPRNASLVTIPLRAHLLPDSYTVRYRVISADSHAVEDAYVFALAGARLGPPVLRRVGGVSDTGGWAVAARFAELVALGLLLALIAFRWLVWRPVSGGALRRQERRAFWRAFWPCVALAGLAETLVLAAKSAVAYGTSVGDAILDPSAAYRFVRASRFGDLLGWRGAALCALAAVALWAWSHESGDEAGDRPRAALAMAVLSALTLGLLATQGHASQAPLAAGSVAVDAVHLGAVAVWIGGLPALALVLRAAPRPLAAGVLARFSRVALIAVGVVVATGLLRLVAEVTDPAQLWETAYGRSVVAKAALLWPVAFLALRNRRMLVALAHAGRPTGAALRVVRRNVQAELALSLGIVAIAALLVAEVPK
jgi:copper transport protein